VFLDFLKTLARRGRFELLRDIRLPLRRLDDARRGRIAVKITTAAPLDEKTRQILSSRLRDLVGGEPRFSVEIDPEMIGGIVVRVGDVVYDASIATQLELARREMIDRSAHEIQSRRDSFRYPEGN
ncbi:MAG: F0F1 ATP synthase subunit delta, partial [Thermoguttaceae bacterium]|nr:F0F1 ATP synthase subunit delta [Thermoguttaceae bacterium]